MSLNQKHTFSLLDVIRDIVVFKKTCQKRSSAMYFKIVDKSLYCFKILFETHSGVL